jgi:inhibitor of cysteine peptidase
MNYRTLAALAIIALPLSGCSNNADPAKNGPAEKGPTTETIQISYDDLLNQNQISRSTDLAVGDFLQVSLGSNPSTGFRWAEQMTISDPKVLAQTGHEVIAPRQTEPGETPPGTPGSEVWMLQAMAPGNTTVSTTYSRPWPGGEKDSWVFSVNVTVR